MDKLLALPPAALVAIGVLVVVQLVLDVIALVDLYRLPRAEVVFDNKWVWVAIIVLVNTIGAILYLVIGRKPAAAAEVRPSGPTAVRGADAADMLYGSRKDADRR